MCSLLPRFALHPRGWPLAVLTAAGLCLGWSTPAFTADPDPAAAEAAAVATGSGLLETALVVEKLLPAEPPERPTARFVPAGRLQSGDEVHYTVRVTNPGKQPVTDVQVTKRMPVGLQYVPKSATGPASDVEFSTDGGNTFATQPEGGEYTHVRWRLRRPLPAGATALLRFRATFR